jgi:hypothetical protein
LNDAAPLFGRGKVVSEEEAGGEEEKKPRKGFRRRAAKKQRDAAAAAERTKHARKGKKAIPFLFFFISISLLFSPVDSQRDVRLSPSS